MIVLTGISMAQHPPTGTPIAGHLRLPRRGEHVPRFFAWYRGLAIGPMAQVSQVQLVQPVMTICWAALFLGEELTWSTILGGTAVIACAGIAVRARLGARSR